MWYRLANVLPFIVCMIVLVYIYIKRLLKFQITKIKENKLYEIFKNNPMSIVVMDIGGNIKYANPKFLDMKGYTNKEVIGQKYLDFYCDPKFKKVLENIKNRKCWSGELYTKDKQGVYSWMEVYMFKIEIDCDNKKAVNLVSVENDITDKKIIENNLKRFNNIYLNIASNIPHPIYRFLYDSYEDNYRFTYISPTCEKLFGISDKEIISDPINVFNIICPDDFLKYDKALMYSKEHLSPFIWTGRINCKEGIKWIKLESMPNKCENNNIVWNGIVRDVTKQRNDEQEINELINELEFLSRKFQKMSYTDSLTGVYNRRRIIEIGRNELLKAKFDNADFWVVMADIDKFKFINDNYGHEVGDKVLINIAYLCKKVINGNIHFGRIGGEEFLFIITGLSKDNVIQIMDTLRKCIESSYICYENENIYATVSMGISCMKDSKDTLEDVINSADRVLYKAKNSGRNKIWIFDE